MQSLQYEQVLTKEGVEFTYMESLDLSAIDERKSLAMQARLETPIDEELIAQYEALYKEGSDGPPLVVWKMKNRNTWVLIDGNQRKHAAERAKRKTLDAYQVNCEDPKVLDRLTWSFNNNVNGRRLSFEESKQHALSYVRKYGASVKEAAALWGISEKTLYSLVKAEELRNVLRTKGVPHCEDLPDSKLNQMSPIFTTGEDLFTMAAGAAIRNGLTDDDISDILTEVKQAKTADEKKRVILEYDVGDKGKARRAETKGGKVKVTTPTPRDKLYKLIKEVNTLLDRYKDAPHALRLSGASYKQEREDVIDMMDKLAILFGAGAQHRRGGVG